MDPRDKFYMFHFSYSNPPGSKSDVSRLLRQVADSIDELGDVIVHDVVFSSEVVDGEDDVAMTVYYERPGMAEISPGFALDWDCTFNGVTPVKEKPDGTAGRRSDGARP